MDGKKFKPYLGCNIFNIQDSNPFLLIISPQFYFILKIILQFHSFKLHNISHILSHLATIKKKLVFSNYRVAKFSILFVFSVHVFFLLLFSSHFFSGVISFIFLSCFFASNYRKPLGNEALKEWNINRQGNSGDDTATRHIEFAYYLTLISIIL